MSGFKSHIHMLSTTCSCYLLLHALCYCSHNSSFCTTYAFSIGHYNEISKPCILAHSIAKSYPQSSKSRHHQSLLALKAQETPTEAQRTEPLINPDPEEEEEDKLTLTTSFTSKRNSTITTSDILKALDFASVLLNKGLDTIEDAYTHFRRLQLEEAYLNQTIAPTSASKLNMDDTISSITEGINCLTQWNDPLDKRPRLLVIGSGWGAHALIKIIDSLDTGYRVLCISPMNYFLFTPMLASSSVGTIEFRSIVEPIRDANPTVPFLEGTVLDIHPVERLVDVRLSSSDDASSIPQLQSNDATIQQQTIQLSYDIAVYACGVRAGGSSGRKVPGVTYANCHFLKNIADAMRLRSSVGDLLERASGPGLSIGHRRRMLHFVVVGGGATGVEYIGELTDYLADVTSFARKGAFAALAPYTSITLVHGGDQVLPQFDEPLRIKALSSLQSRGVGVKLKTRVARVESPSRIVVFNKEDKSEEILDCGIIIWAAGTAPVPLTERLLSKLSPEARALSSYGRLAVDPWLRVIGAPHCGSLFALGDASAIIQNRGADNNGGDEILPQTAQVAAQQGAFMARLLNRGYDLTDSHVSMEKGKPVNPDNDLNGSLFASPPVHLEARGGDIGKIIQLRGNIEAKSFEFLNLGLLAFLGGGEALSQIQIGENKLIEAGSTGFLLW
eukprot:CAMPEP_0196817792 /NCGR_PEP_ID=MMETSP1362-20130617/62580_1 /TAXON_ID=163516 /ORGANISM="Leptocylindrus danicus, Strain CCMP1856" /LENGTH=672 /DNA_ID=CAMNT_0042195631 /DNA_START=146 /DNA_END=2161 /DNA_ORIENTATION=-